MADFVNRVFLVNILVDFLLLLGTSRLCGYPVKLLRVFAAALLGGIYTRACLLPGFYFLGNLLWRSVCLIAMSVITYGCSKSALRRGAVFVFLNLAMGGAVLMIGGGV